MLTEAVVDVVDDGPFALGYHDSDGGLAAFYVVAGLAVLAVSLVTNYQYSPKRGLEPPRVAPA